MNCPLAYAVESNFWKERQKAAKNQNPQLAMNGLPLPEIRRPGMSMAGAQVFDRMRTWIPAKKHAGMTALPLQYGSVRKVFKPKSSNSKSQTIIHIQDIHLNQEAQTNISRSLQMLMDHNKVGLVALEGAFDEINLKPFQTFPYPDTVHKVADYLLKENKISGPVHAALTIPTTSKNETPLIFGVDDPLHYHANVEAYRQAAPLLEKNKRALKKWRTDLKERKLSVFSSQLSAFEGKVEEYRDGKIGIGEYLELIRKILVVIPAKAGIQSLSMILKQVYNLDSRFRGNDKFPNAQTFLKALSLESSLNFPQVERERAHLLSKLMEKLDQKESQELLNLSVTYRMGNVSHVDFYEYVRRLCDKNGVNLDRFPAMQSYLQYVLLSEKIDAEKLFQELRELEEATYAELATTDEERKLIGESRRLYLVGKLLDFALTKEEWNEYASKRGVPPHVPRGEELAPFKAFYRLAEARDETMAENLIAAMSNEQWEIGSNFSLPIAHNVVVLVTGGFHSQGIDQKLVEAGCTVITFVPKISKVEDESGTRYLSVFTQEKTPLEKLFEGDKLFLATRPDKGVEMGRWLLPAHHAARASFVRLNKDGVFSFTTRLRAAATPFTIRMKLDEGGNILGVWLAGAAAFSFSYGFFLNQFFKVEPALALTVSTLLTLIFWSLLLMRQRLNIQDLASTELIRLVIQGNVAAVGVINPFLPSSIFPSIFFMGHRRWQGQGGGRHAKRYFRNKSETLKAADAPRMITDILEADRKKAEEFAQRKQEEAARRAQSETPSETTSGGMDTAESITASSANSQEDTPNPQQPPAESGDSTSTPPITSLLLAVAGLFVTMGAGPLDPASISAAFLAVMPQSPGVAIFFGVVAILFFLSAFGPRPIKSRALWISTQSLLGFLFLLLALFAAFQKKPEPPAKSLAPVVAAPLNDDIPLFEHSLLEGVQPIKFIEKHIIKYRDEAVEPAKGNPEDLIKEVEAILEMEEWSQADVRRGQQISRRNLLGENAGLLPLSLSSKLGDLLLDWECLYKTQEFLPQLLEDQKWTVNDHSIVTNAITRFSQKFKPEDLAMLRERAEAFKNRQFSDENLQREVRRWEEMKKNSNLQDQDSWQIIWQADLREGNSFALVSYKGRLIYVLGALHRSGEAVRISKRMAAQMASHPKQAMALIEEIAGEPPVIDLENMGPSEYKSLLEMVKKHSLPMARSPNLTSTLTINEVINKSPKMRENILTSAFMTHFVVHSSNREILLENKDLLRPFLNALDSLSAQLGMKPQELGEIVLRVVRDQWPKQDPQQLTAEINQTIRNFLHTSNSQARDRLTELIEKNPDRTEVYWCTGALHTGLEPLPEKFFEQNAVADFIEDVSSLPLNPELLQEIFKPAPPLKDNGGTPNDGIEILKIAPPRLQDGLAATTAANQRNSRALLASDAGQGDNQDGPAMRWSGQGLSHNQHAIVNDAIFKYFNDPDWTSKLRLSDIDSPEYKSLDPNGILRRNGVRIYFLEDLMDSITDLSGAYGIDPPQDLVSHPGRARKNIYLDPGSFNIIQDKSEEWRAQWARHELAHIQNQTLDEAAIQIIAPLPTYPDNLRRARPRPVPYFTIEVIISNAIPFYEYSESRSDRNQRIKQLVLKLNRIGITTLEGFLSHTRKDIRTLIEGSVLHPIERYLEKFGFTYHPDPNLSLTAPIENLLAELPGSYASNQYNGTFLIKKAVKKLGIKTIQDLVERLEEVNEFRGIGWVNYDTCVKVLRLHGLIDPPPSTDPHSYWTEVGPQNPPTNSGGSGVSPLASLLLAVAGLFVTMGADHPEWGVPTGEDPLLQFVDRWLLWADANNLVPILLIASLVIGAIGVWWGFYHYGWAEKFGLRPRSRASRAYLEMALKMRSSLSKHPSRLWRWLRRWWHGPRWIPVLLPMAILLASATSALAFDGSAATVRVAMDILPSINWVRFLLPALGLLLFLVSVWALNSYSGRNRFSEATRNGFVATSLASFLFAMPIWAIYLLERVLFRRQTVDQLVVWGYAIVITAAAFTLTSAVSDRFWKKRIPPELKTDGTKLAGQVLDKMTREMAPPTSPLSHSPRTPLSLLLAIGLVSIASPAWAGVAGQAISGELFTPSALTIGVILILLFFIFNGGKMGAADDVPLPFPPNTPSPGLPSFIFGDPFLTESWTKLMTALFDKKVSEDTLRTFACQLEEKWKGGQQRLVDVFLDRLRTFSEESMGLYAQIVHRRPVDKWLDIFLRVIPFTLITSLSNELEDVDGNTHPWRRAPYKLDFQDKTGNEVAVTFQLPALFSSGKRAWVGRALERFVGNMVSHLETAGPIVVMMENTAKLGARPDIVHPHSFQGIEIQEKDDLKGILKGIPHLTVAYKRDIRSRNPSYPVILSAPLPFILTVDQRQLIQRAVEAGFTSIDMDSLLMACLSQGAKMHRFSLPMSLNGLADFALKILESAMAEAWDIRQEAMKYQQTAPLTFDLAGEDVDSEIDLWFRIPQGDGKTHFLGTSTLHADGKWEREWEDELVVTETTREISDSHGSRTFVFHFQRVFQASRRLAEVGRLVQEFALAVSGAASTSSSSRFSARISTHRKTLGKDENPLQLPLTDRNEWNVVITTELQGAPSSMHLSVPLYLVNQPEVRAIILQLIKAKFAILKLHPFFQFNRHLNQWQELLPYLTEALAQKTRLDPNNEMLGTLHWYPTDQRGCWFQLYDQNSNEKHKTIISIEPDVPAPTADSSSANSVPLLLHRLYSKSEPSKWMVVGLIFLGVLVEGGAIQWLGASWSFWFRALVLVVYGGVVHGLLDWLINKRRPGRAPPLWLGVPLHLLGFLPYLFVHSPANLLIAAIPLVLQFAFDVVWAAYPWQKTSVQLKNLYLNTTPQDISGLSQDDVGMYLNRMNNLRYLSKKGFMGFFKAVAMRAGVTDEKVLATFDDPKLFRLLALRLHPYWTKARQELNQYLSLYQEHDGAYYVLRALKDKNQLPPNLMVINVDPHPDLFPLSGNAPKTSAATWALWALRDGLAQIYINIRRDERSSELKIEITELDTNNPLKSKTRELTAKEFSKLLTQNPSFFTVDADFFSLVRRSRSDAKYIDKVFYHYPPSQFRELIAPINRFFEETDTRPLRVVLAESPYYRDTTDDPAWIAAWRSTMEEIYAPWGSPNLPLLSEEEITALYDQTLTNLRKKLMEKGGRSKKEADFIIAQIWMDHYDFRNETHPPSTACQIMLTMVDLVIQLNLDSEDCFNLRNVLRVGEAFRNYPLAFAEFQKRIRSKSFLQTLAHLAKTQLNLNSRVVQAFNEAADRVGKIKAKNPPTHTASPVRSKAGSPTRVRAHDSPPVNIVYDPPSQSIEFGEISVHYPGVQSRYSLLSWLIFGADLRFFVDPNKVLIIKNIQTVVDPPQEKHGKDLIAGWDQILMDAIFQLNQSGGEVPSYWQISERELTRALRFSTIPVIRLAVPLVHLKDNYGFTPPTPVLFEHYVRLPYDNGFELVVKPRVDFDPSKKGTQSYLLWEKNVLVAPTINLAPVERSAEPLVLAVPSSANSAPLLLHRLFSKNEPSKWVVAGLILFGVLVEGGAIQWLGASWSFGVRLVVLLIYGGVVHGLLDWLINKRRPGRAPPLWLGVPLHILGFAPYLFFHSPTNLLIAAVPLLIQFIFDGLWSAAAFVPKSEKMSTVGDELVRLLKETNGGEFPIVGVTGDTLVDLRNTLLESGAFDISMGSAYEGALADLVHGIAKEKGVGVGFGTWNGGSLPAIARLKKMEDEGLGGLFISGAPPLRNRGFFRRNFGWLIDDFWVWFHTLYDADSRRPNFRTDADMAASDGIITIELGRRKSAGPTGRLRFLHFIRKVVFSASLVTVLHLIWPKILAAAQRKGQAADGITDIIDSVRSLLLTFLSLPIPVLILIGVTIFIVVASSGRLLPPSYAEITVPPVKKDEQIAGEILHQFMGDQFPLGRFYGILKPEDGFYESNEKAPDFAQKSNRNKWGQLSLDWLIQIFLPELRARALSRGLSLADYQAFLRIEEEEAKSEQEQLRGLLAFSRNANVETLSNFQRAAEEWELQDYLKRILPEKWKRGDLALNVRHVSSAYGQEPYSAAIVIYQELNNLYLSGSFNQPFEEWLDQWSISVDAFDVSLTNLLRIHHGMYSSEYVPHVLTTGGQFFKKVDPNTVQVMDRLRSWVKPHFINLDTPVVVGPGGVLQHTGLPPQLGALSLKKYDVTFSLNTLAYISHRIHVQILDALLKSQTNENDSLFVFCHGQTRHNVNSEDHYVSVGLTGNGDLRLSEKTKQKRQRLQASLHPSVGDDLHYSIPLVYLAIMAGGDLTDLFEKYTSFDLREMSSIAKWGLSRIPASSPAAAPSNLTSHERRQGWVIALGAGLFGLNCIPRLFEVPSHVTYGLVLVWLLVWGYFGMLPFARLQEKIHEYAHVRVARKKGYRHAVAEEDRQSMHMVVRQKPGGRLVYDDDVAAAGPKRSLIHAIVGSVLLIIGYFALKIPAVHSLFVTSIPVISLSVAGSALLLHTAVSWRFAFADRLRARVVAVADDAAGRREIELVRRLNRGEDNVGVSSPKSLRYVPSNQVVVISLESRHNRKKIHRWLGYPVFVQRVLDAKLDSTGRGDMGGFIQEVSSKHNSDLIVVALANPVQGRTVQEGHILVEGQPVHELSYAGEMLFPRDLETGEIRKTSSITELLRSQGAATPGYQFESIPQSLIDQGEKVVFEKLRGFKKKTIVICDTATTSNLDLIARAMRRLAYENPDLRILRIGSAGLLNATSKLSSTGDPIEIEKRNQSLPLRPANGVPVIFATSLNSVSRNHMAVVEKELGDRVFRIEVDPVKLSGMWWERRKEMRRAQTLLRSTVEAGRGVILTTVSAELWDGLELAVRRQKQEQLNAIMAKILNDKNSIKRIKSIFVTGGDAVVALQHEWRTYSKVFGQFASYVPWGIFQRGRPKGIPIVSKSGGFGGNDPRMMARFMQDGLKPNIAITQGDPMGIGPELSVRLFMENPTLFDNANPFVIGNANVVRRALDFVRGKYPNLDPENKWEVREFPDIAEIHIKKDEVGNPLPIIPVLRVPHEWEQGGSEDDAAMQVEKILETATALARQGWINALVRNPINKERIDKARKAREDPRPFVGHTEFLAEEIGTDEPILQVARKYRADLASTRMILTHGDPDGKTRVSVIHASTVHQSLKDAVEEFTTRDPTRHKAIVYKTAEAILRASRFSKINLGIQYPRIAINRLSPQGDLQKDDLLQAQLVLRDAIKLAKQYDPDIKIGDPLPAAESYWKAMFGQVDFVVALYHDQGHIPLKLASSLLDLNQSFTQDELNEIFNQNPTPRWDEAKGIVKLGELGVYVTSTDYLPEAVRSFQENGDHQKRLAQKIEEVYKDLKARGVIKPQILIGAINPHSGEGGKFGREDQEACLPEIEEALKKHPDLIINDPKGKKLDPLPADSVLITALSQKWDAVIMPQLDSVETALAVYKALEVQKRLLPNPIIAGVNVTEGMKNGFVSVSVDHGTSEQLAWKHERQQPVLSTSLLEAFHEAKIYIQKAREARLAQQRPFTQNAALTYLERRQGRWWGMAGAVVGAALPLWFGFELTGAINGFLFVIWLVAAGGLGYFVLPWIPERIHEWGHVLRARLDGYKKATFEERGGSLVVVHETGGVPIRDHNVVAAGPLGNRWSIYAAVVGALGFYVGLYTSGQLIWFSELFHAPPALWILSVVASALLSLLFISFRFTLADRPRPLPKRIQQKLRQEIWLVAADKDDSLTDRMSNISPSLANQLKLWVSLIPSLFLAVVTGGSDADVDKYVTNHLDASMKTQTYRAGSSGAQIHFPGHPMSEEPNYFRPLSELGENHAKLIAIASAIQKEQGIQEPLRTHLPAKITFNFKKVSHWKRVRLAEIIRERITKELGSEIAQKLKVHPTSVAVEVTLVDKEEALKVIAQDIAKRLGVAEEDVLEHTLVVGDSEIDIPMLNLVAIKGGIALWVGGLPHPHLHPDVIVSPTDGPTGFGEAVQCHLDWLQKQNPKLLSNEPSQEPLAQLTSRERRQGRWWGAVGAVVGAALPLFLARELMSPIYDSLLVIWFGTAGYLGYFVYPWLPERIHEWGHVLRACSQGIWAATFEERDGSWVVVDEKGGAPIHDSKVAAAGPKANRIFIYAMMVGALVFYSWLYATGQLIWFSELFHAPPALWVLSAVASVLLSLLLISIRFTLADRRPQPFHKGLFEFMSTVRGKIKNYRYGYLELTHKLARNILQDLDSKDPKVQKKARRLARYFIGRLDNTSGVLFGVKNVLLRQDEETQKRDFFKTYHQLALDRSIQPAALQRLYEEHKRSRKFKQSLIGKVPFNHWVSAFNGKNYLWLGHTVINTDSFGALFMEKFVGEDGAPELVAQLQQSFKIGIMADLHRPNEDDWGHPSIWSESAYVDGIIQQNFGDKFLRDLMGQGLYLRSYLMGHTSQEGTAIDRSAIRMRKSPQEILFVHADPKATDIARKRGLLTTTVDLKAEKLADNFLLNELLTKAWRSQVNQKLQDRESQKHDPGSRSYFWRRVGHTSLIMAGMLWGSSANIPMEANGAPPLTPEQQLAQAFLDQNPAAIVAPVRANSHIGSLDGPRSLSKSQVTGSIDPVKLEAVLHALVLNRVQQGEGDKPDYAMAIVDDKTGIDAAHLEELLQNIVRFHTKQSAKTDRSRPLVVVTRPDLIKTIQALPSGSRVEVVYQPLMFSESRDHNQYWLQIPALEDFLRQRGILDRYDLCLLLSDRIKPPKAEFQLGFPLEGVFPIIFNDRLMSVPLQSLWDKDFERVMRRLRSAA